MNDRNYGFIGLGTMGFPMCLNLIKNGHVVCAYDKDVTKIELINNNGGIACKNITEVSNSCEIIFLSLPYYNIINEVTDEILLCKDVKTKIIIDFSTIAPSESVKINKKMQTRSIDYYDCPVSGAVTGAENGTLTMMLSMEENRYLQIKDVLLSMASKIFLTGVIGSASMFKLINNYLIGINEMAICEIIALSKKENINLEKLFEIINNCSGRSSASERIFENFLNDMNYEKGFKIDLLYKDLKLMIQECQNKDFQLTVCNGAISLLETAKEMGFGNNCTYGVCKIFETK